jgi:hypothetical protein
MTNSLLSPSAQAVLDAFLADWADSPLGQDRQCLAAALRAAADHCLPQTIRDRRWIRVEDILAIAAELEQAP